ncbi:hypothetical protein ACETU7_09360 [Rhodococcus sp. 3Y1]
MLTVLQGELTQLVAGGVVTEGDLCVDDESLEPVRAPSPMTDLVILADPRLALLSSVTPTLLFGVMVTSASVRSPLSVTPSDGRNVPLEVHTVNGREVDLGQADLPAGSAGLIPLTGVPSAFTLIS